MRFFFLSCVVVLLSACGAGGKSTAADNELVSAANENWAVELHVTGGFAGVQRSIYVGNNAKVIVKDARRRLYIEWLLNKEEVEEIAALLPQSTTTSSGAGRKCRDCFNYHLAFKKGNQNGKIQADDTTLAETRDKELIHKLIALQNFLIKKHKKVNR